MMCALLYWPQEATIMTTTFRVIAGQVAYDAEQAMLDAVAPLTHGLRDSEALSRYQTGARSAIPAEIVKSIYGWSLRYASGVQGFSLIASARQGSLDGTYDAAVAAAHKWVGTHTDRYVFVREEIEDACPVLGCNSSHEQAS